MTMNIARVSMRSFLLPIAVVIGIGVGADAAGAPVSAFLSDDISARSNDLQLRMAKNDNSADRRKKAKKKKHQKEKSKNGKGDERREDAWDKGRGQGNAWGKGHGSGKPDKE